MTASSKPGLPGKTPRRLPAGYPALLGEIKNRIRSAQYEALKAVNRELVALYWDIGRMILEHFNKSCSRTRQTNPRRPGR